MQTKKEYAEYVKNVLRDAYKDTDLYERYVRFIDDILNVFGEILDDMDFSNSLKINSVFFAQKSEKPVVSFFTGYVKEKCKCSSRQALLNTVRATNEDIDWTVKGYNFVNPEENDYEVFLAV